MKVAAGIPKRETLSYKEVALRVGSSKAFRAVGNILNKNHDPGPGIPCHRVILSSGLPGGYNKGAIRKKEILEAERTEIT